MKRGVRPKGTPGQYTQKQGNTTLIMMETVRLLFFMINVTLVLSRPIGPEAGEKHEALTGKGEMEGYDLGLDEKKNFSSRKTKVTN